MKNGWGWLLFGWGLFFAVVLLGGLGGCLVGFSPWAASQRDWELPPFQFGMLGLLAGVLVGAILMIIWRKKPDR